MGGFAHPFTPRHPWGAGCAPPALGAVAGGICRAALGDYGFFGVSPRRLDHAGLGCTAKSSSLRRGAGRDGRTEVPSALQGWGGHRLSVCLSIHPSVWSRSGQTSIHPSTALSSV